MGMDHSIVASVLTLSDEALLAETASLRSRERGVTARLVVPLAEVDTRRLAEREGHGSLFAYCQDVLGLSESEAYARIGAARAGRGFPLVLELLEQGRVTLTAVAHLSPYLTAENQESVLRAACGKKKGEIAEMVAALAPRAPARTTLRRVAPAKAASPVPVPQGAAPPARSTPAEPVARPRSTRRRATCSSSRATCCATRSRRLTTAPS
jgi:hypothetical protein